MSLPRERRRDLRLALILAVVAAAFRLPRLGFPAEEVFDEVYHAKTALQYLNGEPPTEWVHPPTAKLLIAVGVWAFGYHPWAWRLLPALAGIALAPVFFLLARRVLATERAALLASVLLLADGVYLVQSRTAMTNIFAVLFQVAAALLVLLAALRERLHAGWMIAAGVALGLAVSTRWTSLWAAAFLGLDVDGLLDGARAMRRHCWTASAQRNVGVLGAVLMHGLATRRGRNILITMPYADGLVHLADWYRQLWAESLGKRRDRRGRLAETGQTPVTSLGATDQHSQVQLYMEGPQDKVVAFLEVQAVSKDVRIPRRHQDLDSLGYLGGRTLGELIAAEKRGTEIALTAAGRPSLTYLLPRISAHVVGQLLYLFELQTALSGELYGIDAFDQPGVEAGKMAAYALMGRKGHEKDAARLKRELGRRRAVV